MEKISESLPWTINLNLKNICSLLEGATGSAEIASESESADRAYCALILIREARNELNKLIKNLNEKAKKHQEEFLHD